MNKKAIRKPLTLFLTVLIVFYSATFAFAAGVDNITATYGDTLNDVELPESYSWQAANPAKVNVGNVGTNSFNAIHTLVGGGTEVVSVSVTVSPAFVGAVEVITEGSLYYTGNPVEPTVIVSFKGRPLVKSQDYKVSYEDNTNVGTAKIVIEGIGNFKGKTSVTFSILKTDVTGVVLDRNELELTPGKIFALSARVLPSNATFKGVAWSSSDTNIATVDDNGLVAAVANGSAIITVKSNDGEHTAECTVNVVTHVESVIITADIIKMRRNDIYNLKAIIYPWNATDKTVVWTSSDSNIATVDSNGFVTAVADGSAIITVKTNDGGYTSDCAVNVVTRVEGMAITVGTVKMRYKDTYNLKAMIYPWDATDGTVLWTSSDESVITVDENGVINSVGKGFATVTATTEDGAFTDTCEVEVFYAWWQYILYLFMGCIWYF